MKLRWRILTRAELEAGAVRGAVTVTRTEHYAEKCVLEWQAADEPLLEFWQPVEMIRVPAVRPASTALTRDQLTAWLTETTAELQSCSDQFKASVRLRIQELNRLLAAAPAAILEGAGE